MFFTCSIRGDLWSMCKETGYNASFDSCRKLQKACCLSDIPFKMMMTMAGSSSPRISRKVIPVDIPSGDCESWSLICTLCHTLGMGVLGKGGLRAAVAFLFFHFSSAAPLRAISKATAPHLDIAVQISLSFEFLPNPFLGSHHTVKYFGKNNPYLSIS